MCNAYRYSAIRFWTLGKSLNILTLTIIGIYVTSLSHADESVRPNSVYSEVSAAINTTMRAYHYDSPAQESAVAEALNITASPDDPAADDMRGVFVAAHDAVAAFWSKPFPEQVSITLAADRANFDAGFPPEWGIKTQCWMVGAGVADFLLYLSPSAWAEEACEHDPDDAQHVRDIAVHELTHVYHGQVNPTRDFAGAEEVGWFVEGLAVVVAGQLNRDRYSDPADAVREGAAPEKLQSAWSGQHRYAVAGSVVDYIDKTYGRDVLFDLMSVTTEVEFLTRLGVSEQQLLDAWRVWVLAN